MFELWTLSTDSKFDKCFQRPVVECKIVAKILVLRPISYAERARERRQTFFLKFNLSHKNVQHNFCSVMCYTVLIWTLILLTSGNNVLLQLLSWPKPSYFPTDKIIDYSHSHLTNFESWNSHLTNANFEQLRHVTNSVESNYVVQSLCIVARVTRDWQAVSGVGST